MLLIPYFWDKTSPDWYKLGVFLCSGGRQLWGLDETDTDSEIREILKDNGFPLVKLTRSKDTGIVFAEIDHQSLNIKQFYLWSEVNPDTSDQDVWRIYKVPANLYTSCPVFNKQFWATSGLSQDVCTGLRT
jgi:hypothetical protein